MVRRLFLGCLIFALCSACAKETENSKSSTVAPAPKSDSQNANLPVILAFGDSLTAGQGVRLSDAYPARLQNELNRLGYHYRVINAGVSGETTGGGLARIDSALADNPAVVILELGANDGLQGLPLREAKSNLEQMIAKSQHAGAKVLIAGITLPLNYGPDYIHSLENMYPELAKQSGAELMPFFLEGVAGKENLNQEDGIHPTAAGYAIIVDNLVRYLEPLLSK